MFKICRLCGEYYGEDTDSVDGGLNLFNEASGKLLVEEIQQLLNIKIFEDDPLPKFVCHVCTYKIDTFIRFRDSSQEIQMSLWKNFIAKGSACFEEKQCNVKTANFRHPLIDPWLWNMILRGVRIDRIDPAVKYRIWKLYRALWKKKEKNTSDKENDILLKLAAMPIVPVHDIKTLHSQRYRRMLDNQSTSKLTDTVNRLKSLRMYRAIRGLNSDVFDGMREDSPSPPLKRPRRGASRVLCYDDDNSDYEMDFDDSRSSVSSTKTVKSNKGEMSNKGGSSVKEEMINGKKFEEKSVRPVMNDLENVLPAFNIPFEVASSSTMSTLNDTSVNKSKVSSEQDNKSQSSSQNNRAVISNSSGEKSVAKSDTTRTKPNILRKSSASITTSKTGVENSSKENPSSIDISKTIDKPNLYIDVFKSALEQKKGGLNDGTSSLPLAEELNLVPELDVTCEDDSPEYEEDPVLKEVEKALLEHTNEITSDRQRSSQKNDNPFDGMEVTDEQIIEAHMLLTNNEADPLAIDSFSLQAFEASISSASTQNTSTIIPSVQIIKDPISLDENPSRPSIQVNKTYQPAKKNIATNQQVSKTPESQSLSVKKPDEPVILKNILKKPTLLPVKSAPVNPSPPPSQPKKQQSLTLDQQIEGILVQILQTNKTQPVNSNEKSLTDPGNKQGTNKQNVISESQKKTAGNLGNASMIRKCPPALPISAVDQKPNLQTVISKALGATTTAAAAATTITTTSASQSSGHVPTIRVRNFSNLAFGDNTRQMAVNSARQVSEASGLKLRTIAPAVASKTNSPISVRTITTASVSAPVTCSSSTAYHMQMNNVRVVPPNVTVTPNIHNSSTMQAGVGTVHVSPGMIPSSVNAIHVVSSNVVPPSVNAVQVVPQNVVQPTVANVSTSVIQSVNVNNISQSHNIVIPQQPSFQPEPVVQVSMSSHIANVSSVPYVNVQQNPGTLTGYTTGNIAPAQDYFTNFGNNLQNSTVSTGNPAYPTFIQNINSGSVSGTAFNSNQSVIVSQAASVSASQFTTPPSANSLSGTGNSTGRYFKHGDKFIKILTKPSGGSNNLQTQAVMQDKNKTSVIGNIGYLKSPGSDSGYVRNVIYSDGTTSANPTPSSSKRNLTVEVNNYISKHRGKFLCVSCCALFESHSECVNHVAVHLPNNYAFCHVCGIRMKDMYNLKHHVDLCLQEQSPSADKLYCVVCKMNFASKFGMMYHKCNMSQVGK